MLNSTLTNKTYVVRAAPYSSCSALRDLLKFKELISLILQTYLEDGKASELVHDLADLYFLLLVYMPFGTSFLHTTLAICAAREPGPTDKFRGCSFAEF